MGGVGERYRVVEHKVKVEVEVIVVGDEWLDSGISSKHRHHGRPSLHETQIVEVSTDVVDGLDALDDQLAGAVVEDDVWITFVGGVGREELSLARADAKFSLLGARSADDTNNVTTLEVRVVSDEGVRIFSISVEGLMVFARRDVRRLIGEKGHRRICRPCVIDVSIKPVAGQLDNLLYCINMRKGRSKCTLTTCHNETFRCQFICQITRFPC